MEYTKYEVLTIISESSLLSVQEYLQGREKFLNIMKDSALVELNLNHFSL